jgi:ADP-ribose pyrophosphatase YjhB (NUDIX family)
MITLIILLFICLFIAYLIKNYRNKQWHKKPLDNFPFLYKGKIFWYSRSVATTALVLCKNTMDEWCVLANKRGSGAPDFKGYWNIVCGYLQFHMSGEENIVKEIWEETGLKLSPKDMNFFNVVTNPKENKQNVVIRYYSILNGVCDDYPLTNQNSEPNEVADIKWIPLSTINEYKWAFNHLNLIKEMSVKILK